MKGEKEAFTVKYFTDKWHYCDHHYLDPHDSDEEKEKNKAYIRKINNIPEGALLNISNGNSVYC